MIGDSTETASGGRRPNPLRELSEQDVLEAILADGPLTRPQIAQRTELSKVTVGAAVARLEQAGLIRACGRRHGNRGRSPVAYEIRADAGFVVGIDIGGTNIRATAADVMGEPLAHEHELTSADGARAVAGQVLDLTGRIVMGARGSHERLLGIAVSTPGVVDRHSNRVTSLAHNVSHDGGFDPLGPIRQRFDVPVALENNVNLAALAEARHGLAAGVATYVFVAVGAGVGMGVVIGGRLVRGAHGAAGEIGYLPSSHDPFDQRHRLHGGLEDEIGAAAISGAFAQRTGRSLSAREIFELAQEGHEDACEIVERVALRLGTAIASVIAVLDPELVVLGGGIGASPLLLAPVRATVAELVPGDARIETTVLGDAAAVSGAIELALHGARAELFTRAGR